MTDTQFNSFEGLVSYDYMFFAGVGSAKAKEHRLECWLEYEPADPGVGLAESWAVFYAFLGGVDISELLSEEVKTEIIEQARLTFESFEEDYDVECG